VRRWILTTLALLLAAGSAAAAGGPRVLVLGFDGMDPRILAELRAQGDMPNVDRMLARGGQLRELGTSIPPQSPVAWSNFTTGRDPGGHGIFDFIHRDPQTMLPTFSASEATPPTKFWSLGGWKLPRDDAEVRNLRRGTAFWELLAGAGVDVTIFKIPSNFPPIDCEARCLAGMGTPDMTGNYGISTMITDDPPRERDPSGGHVKAVTLDRGRFSARLPGPKNTYRQGDPQATVEITGRVDAVSRAVWLDVGGTEVVLGVGDWSDWVTVSYPMVPLLQSVSGICRFYLIAVEPHLRLYVTPMQLDPRDPAMPISTPNSYSRELAEAIGPYYTQGLPDDTNALENGFFSDDDFVRQSRLVFDENRRQLAYELKRFATLESGLLFFYFNSPDQTCHMCWRNMDASSPTHTAADHRHEGRIREVYRELDAALGLALDGTSDDTVVMIMSDHGFAPWNRAFHVNTWLLENGYLVLREGVAPSAVQVLQGVDWTRTRAYALGINSLYLNLNGREAQGIVNPGREQEQLLTELVDRLQATTDPLDGRPAIKYAYRADRIYHGEARTGAPDIVLGYHRGWRGSNESALGAIPPAVFSDNLLKWSGDHCIAADEVPGILLSSRPILRDDPSLVDMAPTILRLFGVIPPPDLVGDDLFSDQPEEVGHVRR
jgi:predicted AlkP superfamily phosphohydrolase/phosphomutase